jgi:integrase
MRRSCPGAGRSACPTPRCTVDGSPLPTVPADEDRTTPVTVVRHARNHHGARVHVRVVRLPGPFARAAVATDVPSATPYTLRHSFCSLLLHEGRSVIYVARQLGHDAKLTLSTYGHVIDEPEDAPRVPAEEAIRAARRGPCVTGVEREAAS